MLDMQIGKDSTTHNSCPATGFVVATITVIKIKSLIPTEKDTHLSQTSPRKHSKCVFHSPSSQPIWPPSPQPYQPLLVCPLFLPTTRKKLSSVVGETGTVDTSKPNSKLVFSSGVGKEAKREQCDGDPTNLRCWQNKRCDITDLECWQHHHGDFDRNERREKAARPVYGIPDVDQQVRGDSVNVEDNKG